MSKSFLLRLHGWLGISAGLVLAVVGLSGASMAFQPQVLRLLNPGVMTVQPPAGAAMLSPEALYERVLAQMPERPVQALTLSGRADQAALVVLAREGRPRGEPVWTNPYTGEMFTGELRGEAAFEWLEDLHRNLLADDFGKAVTGICAFILVFMALSGLWLRWSRRPRGLRGWLMLRGGLRGRAFLWQLHAVAGTWVFALLLFSAGTGLNWSYDWYKTGIHQVLGVQPGGGPRPSGGGKPEVVSLASVQAALAQAWPVFQAEVGVYRTASIALGGLPQGKVRVEYLPDDAVNERARNIVQIEGDSIRSHELFTDKPLGEQWTSSWKFLHTGRYWGWPGQLLLFLSSLALPVFAVVGMRLYFTRPRR